MAELIYFVFVLVSTRNLTVIVLHFANFTNFFLPIWKAIFNVAEENQEECLGIQDQASGEVQVSMEAEVSHCHLLAKRRAGLGMHLVMNN